MFRAETDLRLARHLKEATYTIGNSIRVKIEDDIKRSSIPADEVNNCSNQEQLTLVIRFEIKSYQGRIP